MIDYKNLTHDDLDNMSFRKLLEIPVEFLEENYHDIYLELYCKWMILQLCLKMNILMLILLIEYFLKFSQKNLVKELFCILKK